MVDLRTGPGLRCQSVGVLDLYARNFEERQLTEREYVISSDQRTSIQTRCRCHPTLPPGKARMMRVDSGIFTPQTIRTPHLPQAH